MTNKAGARWATFVIPEEGTGEILDYEEHTKETDADERYRRFDEDVVSGYYEDYDTIEVYKVRLLKSKEMGVPKVDEAIYE